MNSDYKTLTNEQKERIKFIAKVSTFYAGCIIISNNTETEKKELLSAHSKMVTMITDMLFPECNEIGIPTALAEKISAALKEEEKAAGLAKALSATIIRTI